MAVALAEAEAGRDLVPGDPDAVEGLAAGLAVLASGLSDSARRLADLDDGAWQGAASEAFRRTLGDQPQRYAHAGEAFGSGTRALRRFADVLRAAQAEAQRAIAVYREAEAASQRWQAACADRDAEARRLAPGPGPAEAATAASVAGLPAEDPGEAGRGEAEALLDRARADVDAQARAASTALGAAAEDAPDEPSFWSSLWDGAGEFVGGLWDNTGGALVDTVGALLEDPLGFVADAWDNLYDRVAVWNWDTFVETWKQDLQDLVAWDDWAAGNWQRALGSIAGNLVLGLGVGKLVSRILRRRGDGDGPDGEPDGDGEANRPTPEPDAGPRRTGPNGELIGLPAAQRLRPTEQATAYRLWDHPEMDRRTFSESSHDGAEVVDDLGRSYDFLGTPAASQHWNEGVFLRSIDNHPLKSNEYTVVDLTDFAPEHVDVVRSHIDSLSPVDQGKILRIGF